ncbi:hypothetical protein TB1_005365 [Malus domestica]
MNLWPQDGPRRTHPVSGSDIPRLRIPWVDPTGSDARTQKSKDDSANGWRRFEAETSKGFDAKGFEIGQEESLGDL